MKGPEKISGKYHESKKFLKVHANFNVDCSINHKSWCQNDQKILSMKKTKISKKSSFVYIALGQHKKLSDKYCVKIQASVFDKVCQKNIAQILQKYCLMLQALHWENMRGIRIYHRGEMSAGKGREGRGISATQILGPLIHLYF